MYFVLLFLKIHLGTAILLCSVLFVYHSMFSDLISEQYETRGKNCNQNSYQRHCFYKR